MKVHLFLKAGVLKVTTEEIPVKPRPMQTMYCDPFELSLKSGEPTNSCSTEFTCICQYDSKLNNEYNSAIAAIKERATLVGNYNQLDTYTWQIGEDHPYRGFKVIDIDDHFTEIECEVKYKISATGMPFEAIISPLVPPVGEKEHIDDDFYLLTDVAVYGNEAGDRVQIGNHEYVRVEEEESQDEDWIKVYNISKSMGRDNAIVLYKELFTIQRITK